MVIKTKDIGGEKKNETTLDRKSDLENQRSNQEGGLASKSDLVNQSGLQSKSDLKSQSNLGSKSDLVNESGLQSKSDLENLLES